MKARRLLLAAIGSLLVLSNFVAAWSVFAESARIPEFEYWHDEGTYVAADCGSFLAIEDFTLDVNITVFFDGVGEPIRAQIQVLIDGQITNSETGLTLRDSSHHTYIEDIENGTWTDLGLEYAITVPGQGIAILDAGKLIWEDDRLIFQGGPHQFLEGGPDLFCAALD